MQNTRYELLNKLQAKLGDAITIYDEFDGEHRLNFYSVSINLGTGWASSYEGGYWGDCEIENDELYLNFIYGNIYDAEEVDFGEGTVQLKYKGGTEANGLAYTGALDKMIGDSLINNYLEPNNQFITCSGSLNFELVQKVLMTDIGIMIGVGAPTSLAIDLANKFDITLIGFVKRDSFNIYTNNKKVIVD